MTNARMVASSGVRFFARLWLLPLLPLLMLCAACGRPIFTDQVKARYALEDKDLRRIQFFTSDEIILRRELDDQEKTVTGNAIAIRGGERIEEVVIPARTPGVAVRVEAGGNLLLVSFAPSHPDRALWFGVRHLDGDMPTEGRSYELMPLANPPFEAGPFTPEYTKGFLVAYGGRRFRVLDGKMWRAHLLYDLEESFDENKVKEQPPGWRITDKTQPLK